MGTTTTRRIRIQCSSTTTRLQTAAATARTPKCIPECLQPRKPRCARTTTTASSGIRPRRARQLHLPVLELHGQEKSTTHRHQLLWPKRAIKRMHQRCKEHVRIPEPAFRLQEGGHGASHRRPAEPHESTHESEYSACHALASQGCATE